MQFIARATTPYLHTSKVVPLPVLAQRVSAVLAEVAGVCMADVQFPSDKAPADLLECSESAYSSV